MQLTCGAAEGLGQRRKTYRDVFLNEMDQVLPWARLLALIEPHCPFAGRRGPQPCHGPGQQDERYPHSGSLWNSR